MGGARFDIPCTAQKGSTAAAADLPPPPTTPSISSPGSLPHLVDTPTDLLTPAQVRKLREIAASRQAQIHSNVSKEEA